MRSNVCRDGEHIIRPPKYRPGSLCMHDTENLKIWQAPTSLLLMPLNVTCCDIHVYIISNKRVTCVIAANYPSSLVLQLKK